MGNVMSVIGAIPRLCALCAITVFAVLPSGRAQNLQPRLDVWDIELGVHVSSPRLQPIGPIFINKHCEKELAGKFLVLETNYFRKRGQHAFDPATQTLTPGQFESSACFEMRRVRNAGGRR